MEMSEASGMPGKEKEREREREMYAFFLGNPQGMNTLANLMCRLEDIIKFYVKYTR
jgi:hypothetical protein